MNTEFLKERVLLREFIKSLKELEYAVGEGHSKAKKSIYIAVVPYCDRGSDLYQYTTHLTFYFSSSILSALNGRDVPCVFYEKYLEDGYLLLFSLTSFKGEGDITYWEDRGRTYTRVEKEFEIETEEIPFDYDGKNEIVMIKLMKAKTKKEVEDLLNKVVK